MFRGLVGFGGPQVNDFELLICLLPRGILYNLRQQLIQD